MKVLGICAGGMLALGWAAVFAAAAMIEQGEITKAKLLLGGAGLALMGIGVVLVKVYERVEELYEGQGC
ncbi:MAG: hypothetical protein IJ344_04105 [Clostridia bacterium]|nr:hypothetical protein [Clostridia bacterium]